VSNHEYRGYSKEIDFEKDVERALREKFNRTAECAEEWVELSQDYIETQFGLGRPALDVAHEIFMERVAI
jgi:hypothetical protein